MLPPFPPPSGACHKSSFFLRPALLHSASSRASSRRLPHLPVISHRSFILFHASGTSGSSGIYLLLAKHPARFTLSLLFNIYSSLIHIFADSLASCPSRRFPLGNSCLLQISPFAYSTSYLSPVELPRDRIFLCVFLPPFRPKSPVQSGFSVVLTMRRSVPYPLSRLSTIALSIHPRPLISSHFLELLSFVFLVRADRPLSVFLFSYSSLASLVVEESLYTSALSIARFASLFSPYFSNLPEIVLFLSRDRLCRRCPSLLPSRRRRPPFSPARAHGLLVASLRILVRFNFLGNPLLPPIFTRFTRTASYPQAHSISAPSLFEISVFRFVRAGFLAFTSYSLSLQSSTF